MPATTYLPRDVLSRFIKAFVISESTDESIYRVLPDTGIVVGFQYRGRLSRINAGSQTKLSQSGITGLRDVFIDFKNESNTGTVLVIFKEGGAAEFFKQPLHEFFRESLSLDHFMLRSELLSFEDKLCEANSDLNRIEVVENFLIARMLHRDPDKLVSAALALIHKSKGNLRITELAEHLNISQSPLEKRFRQIVGTSPKKFAAIVRFKHTVTNYNPDNSLTSLGYQAGFYDQAHFVKEFRQFTGQTPEKFLNRK